VGLFGIDSAERKTVHWRAKSNVEKTVAILGASGYIGRHIIQALLRSDDFKIKIISRRPSAKHEGMYKKEYLEFYKGDLLNPQSLKGYLKPGCTIINLAYSWNGGEAANIQMAKNLVKECKDNGIKRLVHCSTAAVVGRASEDLVTEETPCRPATTYGITKLKIEKVISEETKSHFDVGVLRPTSVFGPKGEPLKKLAGDMMGGRRAKNYLKSCLFGARRMNLVSITNVVDAILFLAMHKNDLNGQTFIVSDDDSPANNFADVEGVLMKKLNIKKYSVPKIPIPLGLLGLLLRAMGRNNTNPRCNYSAEKLKKLGFVPQVPFEDALDEYANWYLTSLS
jgi:nucleoside-diphosphate-sugar epimerase